LRAWAANLPPWSSAYALFLADKGLGRAYQTYSATAFGARQTNSKNDTFVLEKVNEIRGVIALPADSELTFGPALTVVFGRNGAGKSASYAYLAVHVLAVSPDQSFRTFTLKANSLR
jgi:hypothetical protein